MKIRKSVMAFMAVLVLTLPMAFAVGPSIALCCGFEHAPSCCE